MAVGAQIEGGRGFGLKRWFAAAGITLAAMGGVGLAVSLGGSEDATVPVTRQVSSDAAAQERLDALKRYHEENAIPATAVAPAYDSAIERLKTEANTPTVSDDSQAALRRMKEEAAGR